jgi:hypothetical protein
MSEIFYGGKFLKINALNEDGYPTVDLSALSDFEKVVLN